MKLKIRVTSNASRNEILGPNEHGEYRVKIQSPPVDGAANKNLVKFLAGVLGIAKSKINIIGGEKSRNKLLEITGNEQMIRRKMEGAP